MDAEHIKQQAGLRYFTYRLDECDYGGWYRSLEGDRIEVLAVGLVRTVPLDGRAPEAAACEALDEFVRLRRSQGLPLPASAASGEEPTVTCEHLLRERGGTG